MDGRTVSAIERGLCVLVGLHREDTSDDIDYACVPKATRGAERARERTGAGRGEDEEQRMGERAWLVIGHGLACATTSSAAVLKRERMAEPDPGPCPRNA